MNLITLNINSVSLSHIDEGNKRGALGFSVLAIFKVGFSVFAMKNVGFSVLLSVVVSGFSLF